MESISDRAWIETDLGAIVKNARALQALLPSGCRLMAVVKDNGYGHGDIAVAKALAADGVGAFAVATVSEGIRLRNEGIRGEILVLGYTRPACAEALSRYNLTQTVMDAGYARALSRTKAVIKVHIKLDTGMHRLGFDWKNLAAIEAVYKDKNLKAEGIYSHLSASDSLSDEDTDFTRKQIERFFQAVNRLKGRGIKPGALHIQASYGIMNYPGLPCDFARAGIALYGVFSDRRAVRSFPELSPALALRAGIAQIRHIQAGESIGYGRAYISERPMTAAVVTIGYGDGVPRGISGKGAWVLVHGQKAPVIGRICMDQMLIDVSNIKNVRAGDTATLIGRDGKEEIRCEDMAGWADTITNEILSRLSGRLSIYLYGSERLSSHSREYLRMEYNRTKASETAASQLCCSSKKLA